MPDMAAGWTALRSFMRDRCGVQLADDQQYLMDSRLAPVAKSFKFISVDEFVLAACRGNAAPQVTNALIDAMTTHETSFFRDPTFWKAAQDQIFPRFLTTSGPLRIWVAACSSGQEPYSLAMLIHEKFPSLVPRTSIVATDISEGTLEQARIGSYAVYDTNRGITAPRLIRFFERDGVNFRVKAPVRQMISWSAQNLITQPPPGNDFDLVLVRNVLIYFSDALRQQVLGRVKSALRKGGLFAIGTSEIIASHWGTPLAQGWYDPAV